jgi:uncharacterized protein YbaP (TraB family)
VRWGALWAAIVVAGCASAPKPAAPHATLVHAAPIGWGDDPGDRAPGPLLFELSASGGKLDLFGTMHTEPLASLPRSAADRYAKARTVAFEADVENLNVMKMLAAAMLPFTQSLDQMVGPEAWQRIVKYLGEAMPPAALKRFRPWFVTALVLQKAEGSSPTDDVPVEVGMLKQGRAGHKSVRFLETVEQQIAVLDRTMDAASLVELSKQLDQLPVGLQAIGDAYRSGDVRALEAAVADADPTTGAQSEHMRLLLGARNERWIPFLEQLAAEGGAFVAVGAGHLIGKDGLVALLRACGYRVTRVR